MGGDTCWLNVTVRRGDIQRFKEIVDLEQEPDEEENNNVSFHVEEADNGWYNELERAAREGLVFVGDHGPGGEYGPHTFACDSTGQVDMPTDHDSVPVVRCFEDGPMEEDLESARLYWAVYNRARSELDKPRAIAALERAMGGQHGLSQDPPVGGPDDRRGHSGPGGEEGPDSRGGGA